MPCFTQGLRPKNSHSLFTQHSENSGNGLSILPGHFALESVGPQNLLNIITKSPNQILIKEAAISEVLHLRVDLKNKMQKRQWECFAVFSVL